MITFFRRAGLGTKLSLLTGASVATLFLLFTFLLSHNASQQLEDLAVEDLHMMRRAINAPISVR